MCMTALNLLPEGLVADPQAQQTPCREIEQFSCWPTLVQYPLGVKLKFTNTAKFCRMVMHDMHTAKMVRLHLILHDDS